MTAPTGGMRLGRPRGWTTAVTAVIVAVGVILALRGFRGSPPLLLLGGFLIVAGLLGYARALRPWLLDEIGISLAGNRRLEWADVTRITVTRTTPKGGDRDAPHVELTVTTGARKATLHLTSRKEAAQVSALLEQRLPTGIAGRQDLGLIRGTGKPVT
ncbi:MAG: hypothetical protein RL134_1949 [Actinomycetota bacterium]|jgi:hypothetical protein